MSRQNKPIIDRVDTGIAKHYVLAKSRRTCQNQLQNFFHQHLRWQFTGIRLASKKPQTKKHVYSCTE